jgi:hypothetical protein
MLKGVAMVPTYNGWEDTPEDEREALEQWEAREVRGRRSSQRIPRPSLRNIDRQRVIDH